MVTASYQITPVSENYSAEMVGAVGALFLACACGETTLGFLLARLQCHPHPATVNALLLLGGMETKVKLEKIALGAMMINPSSAAKVKRQCDLIREIYTRRNYIAHNIAIMGGGDQLVISFSRLTAAGKVIHDKKYTTTKVEWLERHLYQSIRALGDQLTEAGVTRLPRQLSLAQ
jgi:hypothetical protein